MQVTRWWLIPRYTITKFRDQSISQLEQLVTPTQDSPCHQLHLLLIRIHLVYSQVFKVCSQVRTNKIWWFTTLREIKNSLILIKRPTALTLFLLMDIKLLNKDPLLLLICRSKIISMPFTNHNWASSSSSIRIWASKVKKRVLTSVLH